MITEKKEECVEREDFFKAENCPKDSYYLRLTQTQRNKRKGRQEKKDE